jgi:uncharacterized membrane protein YraQ (UPF0718 family)
MAKPRSASLLDGQLLLLVALLVGLMLLAWWRGGPTLVREGLVGGGSLLLRFALVIAVSFLAAGFAEVLVPREWVEGALGEESGLRGIVLAAAAGIVTPSGPFVSMPIAAVLLRSGAAAGPVVAFVTGWALLALHRLVAWEIPILGARFALFRYAVCIVLPVLAGLIARFLARTS